MPTDSGTGNDLIEGGAGADFLTGLGGNDSFVFRKGFGSDTIAKFGLTAGDQDRIQFSTEFFANYADLQSHMVQSGADTITLTNVTRALLTDSVFDFF
ncbi:hypothetical protein AAII07_33740 [Microvirga sp. 0TCS3.31]